MKKIHCIWDKKVYHCFILIQTIWCKEYFTISQIIQTLLDQNVKCTMWLKSEQNILVDSWKDWLTYPAIWFINGPSSSKDKPFRAI